MLIFSIFCGGCISADGMSAAMAASMNSIVRAGLVIAFTAPRLGYALDLYRHETGGLPGNAEEFNAFYSARFQPAWLEGFQVTELAIVPGGRDGFLVQYKMTKGNEVISTAIAYPRTAPQFYVVIYTDIPLADTAAATLLSHYTRRPVTPANLRSEYLIAEYEGAQNVLPPNLSLDGVRFVPIYPPAPAPDGADAPAAESGDDTATPAAAAAETN